MLQQHLETLRIATRGRGLLEITAQVRGCVRASGIAQGLATLFVRHDLDRFFARLVPDGDSFFDHQAEGPDDMPAHVRSALTATQIAVPIVQGRLALGTWQGIYLWEHRLAAHTRELVVHVLGEPGTIARDPGA